MGDKQFRRIVKQLNKYIFSYGLRRFQADIGPYDPKISEHRKRFVRHCHDGYKKAHALILENTLALEAAHRRLKSMKAPEAALSKNIHQRMVLKDFANSLAWIIAGNDESLARSWCSEAAVEGYLADKNLESELKVVEYVNSNHDGFALLADLTSCVHVGDILVTGGGAPLLIELKEGELNKEIIDALKSSTDRAAAEAEFREKHKGDKNTLKQFERVKRQHGRMELSGMYAKHKDKRFDLALDAEVLVREDEEPSELYLKDIDELCERARKEGFAVTIIDGCLGVIVVRRPISSARIWDASHALYHLEDHEGEKCNDQGDGFSLDEFKAYSLFDYEYINQHFGVVGYLPATSSLINLRERAAKEIATGEIVVGVRFDVARFIELARSNGVDLQEVKARGSDKLSNARYKHKGKILQTPAGSFLGRGIFDRIVYEFETPKYALHKIGELEKIGVKLIAQRQSVSDADVTPGS